MKYVQISEGVLCDLLSSKSKVTDMTLLVDRYAIQLHQMGFLEDFRAILYSNPCRQDDNRLISEELA